MTVPRQPPTPNPSSVAGLREVVSDFAGPSRKLLLHDARGELLFEIRGLTTALTPDVLAILGQLVPREPAPAAPLPPVRVLPFPLRGDP